MALLTENAGRRLLLGFVCFVAGCDGGDLIPNTPARWTGQYEGFERIRFFDGERVQEFERAQSSYALSGSDVVGETMLTLTQGSALNLVFDHVPDGQLTFKRCCAWNVLELEMEPRFLFNVSSGGACGEFPCRVPEPRFAVGQLDDSGLRLSLHGFAYQLNVSSPEYPPIPDPGTPGALVEGNFELVLDLQRR
ncbi:MAG: hypothetical protein WBV82_06965 [Myxococcaceae bacterium]